MLTLKDWYLCKTIMEEKIIARGTVYGHYRIEDGADIHTSTIEEIYTFEEGKYYLETASGSLYELVTEEMRPEMQECTMQLIKEFDVVTIMDNDTEFRFEIMKHQHKIREKYRKETLESAVTWARDNLSDRELYILVEGECVIKAYYREENMIREIKPSVHVGMFTDSILITDWEQNMVDFRYFPKGRLIEPYHWSKRLEGIHIHNLWYEDAVFKGTDRDIICPANETVKIEKDAYRSEGLFNTDALDDVW